MAKDGVKEILTGVVLGKYRVLSYNRYSHILVYECDGDRIQITKPDYDGSGYVEVE